VLVQNQRYRTDEGDTCRIVWIPYWVQTSSGKGFPARILLAKGNFRRSRFGSKVRKLPKKCARDQKQPSSLTQLIQPTWPLQRWGLDLLGPLPPA
jgi:hypothetical protein